MSRGAQKALPWNRAAERFDRRVGRRLRGLGVLLRLLVGLRGAALLAAWAVGLAGLQLLIDWFGRPSSDMRTALLLILLGALAVLGWRLLVRPLGVGLGAVRTAGLVERRFPQLGERLLSAVQFAAMRPERGDGFAFHSPAMMREVLAAAERETADLRIGRMVNYRRLGAASAAGLAAVLAMTLAFVAVPQVMSLWLRRNLLLRDDPWPQLTHLVVEGLRDGELVHPRGDPLQVRARVPEGDRVPLVVSIEYAFDDGPQGKDTMSRVGGSVFVAEFPRVRRPLRFRLRGGDEQTDWYFVRLVERPRVEWSRVEVQPPAYTRLPARASRDNATLVDLLPGSQVHFTIRPNVPLAGAKLLCDQGEVGPAGRDGDHWVATATPAASGRYFFELLAENGLDDPRPTQFTVRLVADEAPRVSLRLPGAGEMITPAAVLPVELDFTDEYGLASAVLVVEVESVVRTRRELSLELFSPGSTRFGQETTLPAALFNLSPGDRITLYGQASDFDDVNGPNVGQSLTANLRVVTEAELLAELSRREQEYRGELEKLIRAQERVRADLLSWMTAGGGTSEDPSLGRSLGRIERQQRHLAARANGLEKQVVQIVREMELNGMLDPSTQSRLGQGVAEPLADLGRRAMPAAAERIASLDAERSSARLTAVDQNVEEILARMRRVLANMLKWEGYQEALTLLRDILDLQGEVGKETQQALERRVRELFGGKP